MNIYVGMLATAYVNYIIVLNSFSEAITEKNGKIMNKCLPRP